MQTVYSPVVSANLATAQYLFRVWHSPIQSPAGYLPPWPMFYGARVHGDVDAIYCLNFNDHLMSIPTDTATICDTANRLAYAESLLYVNDTIHFVSVWLVETSKGIDTKTPAGFLWHWTGDESRAQFPGSYDPPGPEYPYVEYGPRDSFFQFQEPSPAQGFQSYDLVGSQERGVVSDAFMLLDVARQQETGQCRHEWYKGCVTDEDYYRESDGRVMLPSAAPLLNCRFPLFNNALQNMPYTHSGAHVDTEGRLEIGNQALGLRVANCVTDAAQLRRTAMRLTWTHGQSYRLWWNTVMALGEALRRIDLWGFSSPYLLPVDIGPGNDQQATYVGLAQIETFLAIIQNWLNQQAVFAGSDCLACGLPYPSNYDTRERIFAKCCGNVISGFIQSQENGWQMAERADSKSWETFLAIQDLVGAIAAPLAAFTQRHGEIVNDMSFITGAGFDFAHQRARADAMNFFALRWERMQGDMHAILQLLFTWQFQYKPAFLPFTGQLYSVIKSPKYYAKRYELQEYRRRDFDATAKFPRMDGRIASQVPIFAPPHTWRPVIINPDTNGLFDTNLTPAELAMFTARQTVITARRAAEAVARTAANHAEMDALQAYIAGPQGANPLDPWDWRNWSRKSFWVTPISAADWPQMALNALNTPNDITLAQDVFMLSPRIVAAVRVVEPILIIMKDLCYGELALRDAMKSIGQKLLLIGAGTTVLEVGKSIVSNHVQSYAISRAAGGNPAYSPRQFWPPNLTKMEMWGPTGQPPGPYDPTTPYGGGNGGNWGVPEG